jgi:predicted acetyltransferase
MAEFFVVRGCRRRGVGTEIARRVWNQFPGKWEVRVMEANRAAHRFWERAIAHYVGGEIAPVALQKDGEMWQVYSFESVRGSERS